MSKGMAMLIGLALMAVPAGASAQEIGASFEVRQRPAQPGVVVEGGSGSATVPGGWAYEVSRGIGGGIRSPGLASGVAPTDSLHVRLPEASTDAEPVRQVTLLLVPL